MVKDLLALCGRHLPDRLPSPVFREVLGGLVFALPERKTDGGFNVLQDKVLEDPF